MTDALAAINQDHFDTLLLAGTLDEKRKHIFLRVLAETANIRVAAAAAGYSSTAAINRLRSSDPVFAEAMVEAAEAAGDMLEAEAVRRAKTGYKKTVWFKGEPVGTEIQFSDSLLALLLKAAKPDKYADRSKSENKVNLTGIVGIAVVPMMSRSVGDWEKSSIAVRDGQRTLGSGGGDKIVDAEYTEAKGQTLNRT